MLIIAMPKTASTSLLDTLGRLHEIPAQQIYFPEREVNPRFNYVARLHSDMRKLNPKLAQKFTSQNAFYKQHLLPTRRNLSLLEDYKKVILTRKPKEIIAAYRRNFLMTYKKGLELFRSKFKNLRGTEEWVEKARDLGLIEQLEEMRDGWLENSTDHLHLTYYQVIQRPKQSVNLIERYFGIPLSDEVEMSRKRYTRSGILRVQNRFKEMLNQIMNLLQR